ncbi:DNA mismatch repair protein MutS [Blastochloris viridis]|uniref:DNA mismatch repair protein MutS n=2 Tax=Blastochloris viridis TaxID=1079 RepID=A0A0H5BGG5_BLAVI|nr:DNA mismatch repair protein MutS [Blastochloris viridis]BAR99456.1 DNA mismatch repair protein MutS [Blastochloris viridis]CUU43251.1 DNA mismatch repair protein mutS [Blastochloris viridis]
MEAADERVTPLMAQYIEIKTANPDCLLFYRMGDFYEMFFEDAELASRALGIALTKRGKHKGADIPMAGVPVERANDYLQRLIAQGFRVAVCEQLEDPAEARKRGSKSVVKRDVIRLVTPGTITEEQLLDSRRNNWLLAVARARPSSAEAASFGLAWADISTGAFHVAEVGGGRLAAEVARLDPGEIVIADALYSDTDLAPFWREQRAVTPLGRDLFDAMTAERRLAGFFGIATADAFGVFSRLELTAAAAIAGYIERTQVGKRPPLAPPQREALGETMAIDAATRVNLELLRALSGTRQGSLITAIDRTVTAAGARLLADRLSSPLADSAAVNARLDAVAWVVADGDLRQALRRTLETAPDIERALARLALGRGGPRDLFALARGLTVAADLARTVAARAPPAEIAAATHDLAAPDPAVAAVIDAALADELPLLKRDGGFVRAGYDADLDGLRRLSEDSRRVIAETQARYAEETAVKSLKVRHNAQLGYVVEVAAQHGDKLLGPPFNATFMHRQTLAGALRFSTVELSELESKIATAAERARAIELAVFEQLVTRVLDQGDAIKAAARALAVLDVTTALATLAATEDWTRPVVDASLAFRISGGRHPVVEQALRRDGGPFVANDCDLSPPTPAGDAGRLWLITGPNMAGKSTFLRQNALIAVLAQIGAFVPAKSAHIGVVDRLFSRVGAADDLARGRSTFMVEMVETAAILNQAGPRALVILDEIGRGTATFDGLSIAWASLEHLHETNRCRTLFATHFHELTALSTRLKRLKNATVRVKEWHGEVIFLHEVAEGMADRSYGIQVAKLAGLPAAVVARAKVVLAELEKSDRGAPIHRLADDLPLFAALRPKAAEPASAAAPDPVAELLAALDPDDMTPKDALEALYRLKAAAAAT